MKVAVYARVSTEQQVDNYSIDFQRERTKAFCASKGWDDITEYIDGGFSGSNTQRPALQKLINDINKKLIDVVVVYRLDRLSRSQRDTLYLIEELFLPNNVEFISLNETIDTSTPFGRAMIGILSVFAQLERETITERMKFGRYKRVKDNGYYAGGLVNPLGYRIKEHGILEINEQEAEMVKVIYDEYIKLKSVNLVQKRLKELGYPVPRYQRISHTLNRRLYIGEVSFGNEYFPGAHEPIIDVETFEKVQKIRNNNHGRNYGKTKNRHLVGKTQCGLCGETFQIYTTGNKTLKSGKIVKRSYLTCKARRFPNEYHEKCNNKRWRQDNVEETLYDRISKLTLDDITNKANINESSVRKDFKSLINKIDNKIEKLIDLYSDGLINKEKLMEKIDKLNFEKEALLEEEELLDSEINMQAIQLIKDRRVNMKDMTYEEQKATIDTLVEKIIFYEDHFEIVWKF